MLPWETDGRQNAPPPKKKKIMIIENSLYEQTTLFSTFFHLTKMQCIEFYTLLEKLPKLLIIYKIENHHSNIQGRK